MLGERPVNPAAFDLDRFLEAQDASGTYDAALAELRVCGSNGRLEER